MPRTSIRIPFGEAIQEPKLLKPFVYGTAEQGYEDALGLNQLVMLKTIYGIDLDTKTQDARGWTEVDYWAAGQGYAEFDELGYIRKILPHPIYIPRDYRECWVVAGRRSGKTDRVAATCVAYEAALGGHEVWKRKGRPAICFQIAQDIRMAKFALHSINATLESMSFIFNGGGKHNRITQVTADRIDLWNGLTVSTLPPTVKSVRGYDNPIAVLDEVGVWYQDSDSANPDFEIYRAVSPGQAQFPDAKIIGISSPWSRAGMLFKVYEAGTDGNNLRCITCRTRGIQPHCEVCAKLRAPHRGKLVIHTTTAASCNPLIRESWLREELDKDPRAFERECLARFQDSLSGFLSSSLIEKARAVGIVSRPADPRNFYVAAIDPAFRKDAFGFTIVHVDSERGTVVQDYVDRWQDPTGTPLNPGTILGEIAAILRQYNITTVHSDQYTLETLQYIAQQFGFGIQEVTFSAGSKAEIYGNLQQLLNRGALALLDHQETLNELKMIERRLTTSGQVQISAPEGQHDDMATVLAIAAHEAVWMLPKRIPTPVKAKSEIAKHLEETARRNVRRIRETADADFW